MTSQKDQIQTLIAEIDSVLQKTNSRLPWVMSGEIAQQRQVLERVRNYLVILQQQLPPSGLRQESDYASPLGYPPEFYSSGVSVPGVPAVNAQQMMQTILQEMSYLRATVMQPMQADLENLRQRREVLTQELSHLEAERQNQTVTQSSNPQQFTDELVQVLMSRLQESLSQQISQALGNLQAQTFAHGANPLKSGEPSPGSLANPHYEQLQALRSRSDQMLVTLNSTLNIVFESLQRNIHTYQESLIQGLERINSTGQQSEAAFKALISELAQQLNQEASSYLLSSAQKQVEVSTESGTSAVGEESFNPTPEPPLQVTTDPSIALTPTLNFPYPGGSVLATDLSTTAQSGEVSDEEKSLPLMPLDVALEAWLRSTENSNFDITELGSSSLELDSLSTDSTAPQPEVDFPYLSDIAIADSKVLTSDLAATDETPAELDDAFKLLESLSSEVSDPLTFNSLQDTDAQIDQMLSFVQAPLSESPPSTVENTSVEQDEFYQSLFGDSATDHAEPEANTFVAQTFIAQTAVAPLSGSQSNDFSPENTNLEAAKLDTELDNIDNLATLADLTFEPIGSDSELPELFMEATAAETTSITELPASLFDDVSITAPSLEPFPLTLETESLLTDLDPFSLEPDSLGSLADLFQDLPSESAQSAPIAPPAIANDWASLQDFAPMADTPQAVQSDALTNGFLDSEFVLEGREDQFTRAALDENLLPDAFSEVANVNLDLDDFTLNSLSEDLSNVETSTNWQPDSVILDRAIDEVPSLDEFALSLENIQEPVQPLEQFLSDRADLTVEEFGTLFDGAPNTSSPLSSPVVSPSLPTSSLQDTQSLAERLTTSAVPLPPLQVADDGSLPFTLEGMDDLFEDVPDIAPVPLSPQSDLPDISPSSLGMQDLSGGSTSLPLKDGELSPSFTLESISDLFSDAPSVEVTLSPASRPAKEILPFKPNYGQQSAEKSPSFNLEETGNPLIEAPLMPSSLPEPGSQEQSDTPEAASTSEISPPDSPANLGLDEAFESLLGTPALFQPSKPNEQAKEKKKTF